MYHVNMPMPVVRASARYRYAHACQRWAQTTGMPEVCNIHMPMPLVRVSVHYVHPFSSRDLQSLLKKRCSQTGHSPGGCLWAPPLLAYIGG
jgi:hypothetical protein